MEQDYANTGTVAKLCDQIQKLESERDALKAHIERLRDVVLDGVLEWVNGNDELLVRRIWDSLRLKMIETSPQQSLAERDAEESKRHFLYGYHFCRANGFLFDEQLQEAANEYARRIKDGEL